MGIYLKIKGLNGNVTAKGYEKAINIDNYELGVERKFDVMHDVVSNRVLGQIHYRGLTLQKPLDNSSVGLLGHLHKGDTIAEIEIHHTSPETESCFLVNKFYYVVLSSISESHCGAGSTETVELYFSKSEKKYIDHNSAGQAQTPQVTGYDIKKAVTT